MSDFKVYFIERQKFGHLFCRTPFEENSGTPAYCNCALTPGGSHMMGSSLWVSSPFQRRAPVNPRPLPRASRKVLLFLDVLGVARVDHADGLGQVPENRRVVQVQNRRGVVAQDPGKLRSSGSTKRSRLPGSEDDKWHFRGPETGTYHGILGQVVVSASSDGVQLHQILKVGDLSANPFLSRHSQSKLIPHK